MNMNNTAAPPIATPAIAPGVKAAGEDEWEGTADEVCAFVEVAADETAVGVKKGVAVAEDEGPPVDDGLLTPLGPRSLYTSQLEMGAARGQVLAWHKEKSCAG